MSLKCLFGHKWNGCKCERCGEIRDEGHKWTLPIGKCTEKCSICGKERNVDHKWDGCKCERCGVTRHNWQNEVCSRCGKAKITISMIDEMCAKNKEQEISYKSLISDYNPKTLWQLHSCFENSSIDEQREIIRELFIKFDLKDDIEKLKIVYGLAFTAIRVSKDETVNWWAANIVRILALEDELFDLEIFNDFPFGRSMIERFLVSNLMTCELSASKIKRTVSFLKNGGYPNVDSLEQTAKVFLDGWKPLAQNYGRSYQGSIPDSERQVLEKKIMDSCKKMNDISAVHKIVDFTMQLYKAARQTSQMGGGIWMHTIDLKTGKQETSTQATADMVYELGIKMLMNIGNNPKEILLRAKKRDDIMCVPNEPDSNYDNLVDKALNRLT